MSRTASDVARRLRLTAAAALLAAFALSGGCAKRSTTEPEVGRYAISGRIHLVGHDVQWDGTVTGTRVVEDADGVPVELVYGNQVVARAFTQDGLYHFPGLSPGGYRARTTLLGQVQDETTTLTITNSDLVSNDTIELRSFGDLHSAPNPANGLTLLNFGIADTQYVDLRILDLGGDLTQRLYGQELPMGRHDAQWTWVDLQNQPATGPYYWAAFQSGPDRRAQLLLNERRTHHATEIR